MSRNVVSTGSLFVFVAAVLWAMDGFLRRSLYSLPPLTIVFYEHLIGLIFLLPMLFRGLKNHRLNSKDWGLMSVISLLSGLLGTVMFTAALVQVNFISLSVVYLLQKLQPLFAISSARILLQEQINKYYAFWALLAILSAYFVTFKNGYVNFDTGAGTINAVLLALGAAAAWGTSTTFSKMMLNKYPDSLITALRFGLTTVFGFVAVLLLGNIGSLSQPDASQFFRFVVIALSTGMVALYLYYKGLKQIPAKVSTIIELTFPFLVIVVDSFVYGTRLDWSQYLAAVILMLSMYQVSKTETMKKLNN